jgi:hypothetical protein
MGRPGIEPGTFAFGRFRECQSDVLTMLDDRPVN